MNSIAAVNRLALQILSPSRSATDIGEARRSAAEQLTAAANGESAGRPLPAGITGGPSLDSLFDRSVPDITEMKVDLFRRTGEALGVKQSDYETSSAFGAALKQALSQLRMIPNAEMIIASIEKELGLDKLGVSLETVIDAVIDPKGGADEKLTKALQKHIGSSNDPASNDGRFRVVKDDIGLYRIA